MATKYVSALNGQQMDAALTDMAYHTSEAFAIGERNGVPVSSGDVAYHNNAKYYAEQASADATEADAAAARAEAAVPPSTAGAVFFDRAQALTDAQKGQAKANIGAGSTNRNLLDNAYFVGGGSQLGDGVFPINQRGQTAYTGANAHTFDRWKQQYNTNTQLLSNGIRVYGDWDINQTVLENLPTGEPYTLSVKYSNLSGTDGLHLFAYNSSLQTITEVWTHDASGIFTCTFTPQTQIKTIALGYRGSGDGDVVIQAVKLEAGTVSTLANDPPPDFGEELRKCQRYLWVTACEVNDIMASGVTFGTNVIFDLITPVQIRGTQANVAIGVTPYIAVDNTLVLCGGSSAQANIKGNHARFQIGATADLGTYKNCNLLIPAVTFLQVANEL